MSKDLASDELFKESSLLSPHDCDNIYEVISSLPDSCFINRMRGMKTLGLSSYLDVGHRETSKLLPHSCGELSSYISGSNASNILLKSLFDDLYKRLCIFFSDIFNISCQLHDIAAAPGFHIYYNFPEFISQSTHVPHFDLQYQDMIGLLAPGLDRADVMGRTISFTLPISLPNYESGLRIWDFHYREVLSNGKESLVDRLSNLSPSIIKYEAGRIVYHSGHVLHQIKAWRASQEDKPRITLQGHGLLIQDCLYLYW
jgi:hypothetical protein